MLTTAYKHEKLTELLRKEIKRKQFPGNRFHTVKYLMEHYQVSQSTLSRALQPLFQDGSLYSVSGKGTFVAEKSADKSQNETALSNLYCIVSNTEMFSQANNPTDWFVMREIIEGVVLAGQEQGFHVNVTPLSEDINIFKKLSTQPGSLFIFTEYDRYEQQIEYCIREKLPYAVYGRHHEISRNVNQVWVDINDGIRKATEYLIRRGHEHIAFFGDFENSLRHQGYKRALKDAGIRRTKRYCRFDFDGRVEQAQEVGYDLLTELPEVTAVVCSSDLRAVGVVQAADVLDRKFPEFAVTGLDNINDFYPVPRRLTTMEFPRKEIGRELVKAAEDLKSDGSVRKMRIETVLVPGETA